MRFHSTMCGIITLKIALFPFLSGMVIFLNGVKNTFKNRPFVLSFYCMNIFSISDLHLSGLNPKPMDIFGSGWEGHFEKICADWNEKVGEDDAVLICGDISWGITLEEGLFDLKRLSPLKGKKVFIKGNHDYWWNGITKLRDRAPDDTFYFLQNDGVRLGNVVICGSRGWACPGSPDYTERLAAAVELWKSDFGLERMPFYIVELAPYLYNNGYEEQCPYLREQQFEAGRTIPDAGMISTYDLAYDYETTMIHPARKKEVGRRLAYMALSKAYGFGNPVEGPVYKSMSVEGSELTVRFDNADNGFRVAGPLKGFELAGADKVFHPADAKVVMKFGRGPDGGFMVKVTSDEVPEPVAVRYCFRDFLIGNLYNVEGWPAVPFRSDNW